MVVARDRYLAEDACARIRVDYQPLPPVVGIEAARAAKNLVHEDVPGNVGARLEQHVGDAPAAIAAKRSTVRAPSGTRSGSSAAAAGSEFSSRCRP